MHLRPSALLRHQRSRLSSGAANDGFPRAQGVRGRTSRIENSRPSVGRQSDRISQGDAAATPVSRYTDTDNNHAISPGNTLQLLEAKFGRKNSKTSHSMKSSFFRRGGSNKYLQKDKSRELQAPNPEVAELLSKIQSCTTVNDAIQTAHEQLSILSVRDTEVVWKHIFTLLGKSSRNKQIQHQDASNDNERIQHQLESLFNHTKKGIETCYRSDLSFIAFTLANLIKILSNNKHLHQRLNQLLLGDTHGGVSFWETLQNRSVSEMDKLGPKALASIAWSFATISQPMYMATHTSFDASPFFQSLSQVLWDKSDKFTSSNQSNIAWACMTCRVSNPSLFNAISTEFISRRKQEDEGKREMENFDAITLCQIASSFAKADHIDKGLFQCISDCAIPILSSFQARNFANLAHSFATCCINPKCQDGCSTAPSIQTFSQNSSTLFDEIANEFIPKIHTADPQNLANIVWAYATLEYYCQELFSAVAHEALGRLRQFKPQHLCNVAWAMSKYPPSMEIFDGISREVATRGLGSFTAQGLAILASSFATVGYTDPEFWDAVDRAAIQKSSEFSGIECARIAWSFATVGRPVNDLFSVIEEVSIRKIGSFNTQGLANLAHSFSSMGCHSKPLFDAIVDTSLQKLEKFKPQELTMLVLAYHQMDSSFLFDEIASESMSRLEQFTLLDLFNMAISYTKAGHRNEKWMMAIADEVVRRSSNDLSNMHTGLLWAFAALRVSHPNLIGFLTKSLLDNFDELEHEQICSAAWSLASLGCYRQPLFDAFAEALTDKMRDSRCNSQSLANLAWAFATVRDARPGLFDSIANAAEMKMEDFSPQGISNLLWAFAMAGHLDDQLFLSMAIVARRALGEFNSHALANLGWAYSVADIDAECLFGDGAYVNKCIGQMEGFSSEGLSQLHQWNLWRKELNSDDALPPAFAKRCLDEFTAGINHHKSRLQKDVVSELAAMGLVPQQEVQTQSGYTLDAIVEVGDNKIAIEVDGPSHFFGHEPDGATIMKRRQIPRLDKIPILSVPYWEWNKLGKDQTKKQQYLRTRLELKDG